MWTFNKKEPASLGLKLTARRAKDNHLVYVEYQMGAKAVYSHEEMPPVCDDGKYSIVINGRVIRCEKDDLFYIETMPIEETSKPEDKSMDAKTIEAIHKSINHWGGGRGICYGAEGNCGEGSCDLCTRFKTESGCGSCPLAAVSCCLDHDSVYQAYRRSLKGGYCTVDSSEAAEAMLETLVRLLPDNELERYVVGKNMMGEFWTTKPGLIAFSGKPTGITTDGRNRFPQDEEVWAAVAEKEQMDKKWGVGWKYAFPGSKSHHTICTTCGQEVKPEEPELIQGFTMEQWQTIIEGEYLCEFSQDIKAQSWVKNQLTEVREITTHNFVTNVVTSGANCYKFCRPTQIKGAMRPIFSTPEGNPWCHFYDGPEHIYSGYWDRMTNLNVDRYIEV